MIIQSLCNTCLQRYELRVEPSDVSLLRELADDTGLGDCPRGCGGKINLSPSSQAFQVLGEQRRGLREPVVLRAPELYRAVKGGGLPDEIPRNPTVVDALLRANRVVRTEFEQRGRALYLHSLSLEDGSVVHLSSGLHGAQVLKITKEETCG